VWRWQGVRSAHIQLVVADARSRASEVHRESAGSGESNIAAGKDAGAASGRNGAVSFDGADGAGAAERGAAVHDHGALWLGTVDHHLAGVNVRGASREGVVAGHREGAASGLAHGPARSIPNPGKGTVERAAAIVKSEIDITARTEIDRARTAQRVNRIVVNAQINKPLC